MGTVSERPSETMWGSGLRDSAAPLRFHPQGKGWGRAFSGWFLQIWQLECRKVLGSGFVRDPCGGPMEVPGRESN